MPDSDRGNRPQEYKDRAMDAKTERQRVAILRARIARHEDQLKLGARTAGAVEGRRFLARQEDGKEQVYHPYLRPALEDMHLGTLPRIPSVTVESRTEAGEVFEDRTRALLDQIFATEDARVAKTANGLQWDDDSFGVAFGKATWKVDYTPGSPADAIDQEALAVEIERALTENIDPSRAKIAIGDVDDVHIQVHEDALREMVAGDEAGWALYSHIEQHRDRYTVIRKEWAKLERVPVDRFVYDTDVPWEERSFETELKSITIKELLNRGYRNINQSNCPPETKDGQPASMPYEDMTCQVWEFHDRVDDSFYVISATGPADGLFLHKGEWPFAGIGCDIYLPLVFRSGGEEELHGAATIDLSIATLDELARVDFHIRRHVRNHSDYKLGGPRSAGEASIKAGMNDPNRRFVFEGSPESWAMMKEIKPPPVPDTLLGYRDSLLNDLRRMTSAEAQDTGVANPHIVSATESARRGVSSEKRTTNRQDIMGNFLGRVGRTFTALYREFGTMAISVRVPDAAEANFITIDPRELPEGLDVILDVAGETESAKAEKISAHNAYKDFLLQIAEASPTDWEKYRDDYGRGMGIRRPEKYHAMVEGIPTGMNPQAQPGSPGVTASPGTIPFNQGQGFAPSPEQLGVGG